MGARTRHNPSPWLKTCRKTGRGKKKRPAPFLVFGGVGSHGKKKQVVYRWSNAPKRKGTFIVTKRELVLFIKRSSKGGITHQSRASIKGKKAGGGCRTQIRGSQIKGRKSLTSPPAETSPSAPLVIPGKKNKPPPPSPVGPKKKSSNPPYTVLGRKNGETPVWERGSVTWYGRKAPGARS